MPIARAVNYYNNIPIDLFYDIQGPEDGPVVVFVSGLGSQLVHWVYNTYVHPLVALGYRVLRIDNRDTGLSTVLHQLQPMNLVKHRVKSTISNPVHKLSEINTYAYKCIDMDDRIRIKKLKELAKYPEYYQRRVKKMEKKKQKLFMKILQQLSLVFRHVISKYSKLNGTEKKVNHEGLPGEDKTDSSSSSPSSSPSSSHTPTTILAPHYKGYRNPDTDYYIYPGLRPRYVYSTQLNYRNSIRFLKKFRHPEKGSNSTPIDDDVQPPSSSTSTSTSHDGSDADSAFSQHDDDDDNSDLRNLSHPSHGPSPPSPANLKLYSQDPFAFESFNPDHHIHHDLFDHNNHKRAPLHLVFAQQQQQLYRYMKKHKSQCQNRHIITQQDSTRPIDKIEPVYDISDYAVDTILLLDRLNIPSYHIVGFSMGGMISQWVAALQPSRCLSYTGVMTSTTNSQHHPSLFLLARAFLFRKYSPPPPMPRWNATPTTLPTCEFWGITESNYLATFSDSQRSVKERDCGKPVNDIITTGVTTGLGDSDNVAHANGDDGSTSLSGEDQLNAALEQHEQYKKTLEDYVQSSAEFSMLITTFNEKQHYKKHKYLIHKLEKQKKQEEAEQQQQHQHGEDHHTHHTHDDLTDDDDDLDDHDDHDDDDHDGDEEDSRDALPSIRESQTHHDLLNEYSTILDEDGGRHDSSQVFNKTMNRGIPLADHIRDWSIRCPQSGGMLRQIESVNCATCRDLLVVFISNHVNMTFFHGENDLLIPSSNLYHSYNLGKASLLEQQYQINTAMSNGPTENTSKGISSDNSAQDGMKESQDQTTPPYSSIESEYITSDYRSVISQFSLVPQTTTTTTTTTTAPPDQAPHAGDDTHNITDNNNSQTADDDAHHYSPAASVVSIPDDKLDIRYVKSCMIRKCGHEMCDDITPHIVPHLLQHLSHNQRRYERYKAAQAGHFTQGSGCLRPSTTSSNESTMAMFAKFPSRIGHGIRPNEVVPCSSHARSMAVKLYESQIPSIEYTSSWSRSDLSAVVAAPPVMYDDNQEETLLKSIPITWGTYSSLRHGIDDMQCIQPYDYNNPANNAAWLGDIVKLLKTSSSPPLPSDVAARSPSTAAAIATDTIAAIDSPGASSQSHRDNDLCQTHKEIQENQNHGETDSTDSISPPDCAAQHIVIFPPSSSPHPQSDTPTPHITEDTNGSDAQGNHDHHSPSPRHDIICPSSSIAPIA